MRICLTLLAALLALPSLAYEFDASHCLFGKFSTRQAREHALDVIQLPTDLQKRDRNPYFSDLANGMPIEDLQWRALKILSEPTANPKPPRGGFFGRWASGGNQAYPALAGAREKLGYYTAPAALPQTKAFEDALRALGPEKARQAALEFCLASFHDASFDKKFAKELMEALGESPQSDDATLSLLLGPARDIYTVDRQAGYIANQAIINIALRQNISFPARVPGAQPAHSDPEVGKLLYTPVQDIQTFYATQGHANRVYEVTLKDGSRAIFKPKFGEYQISMDGFPPPQSFHPNEANYYELVEKWLNNDKALADGKSMVRVPPTTVVVLKHGDKSYGVGSLQKFSPNRMTVKDLIVSNPALWAKLKESPEWKKREARVRALDFIAGNHEHFENGVLREGCYGNILVPKVGPKGTVEQILAEPTDLIDNAWGRPGQPWFWLHEVPPRDQIPDDLKEQILRFDIPAFRKSFNGRMMPTGIDDVVKRVEALQDRIRNGP